MKYMICAYNKKTEVCEITKEISKEIFNFALQYIPDTLHEYSDAFILSKKIRDRLKAKYFIKFSKDYEYFVERTR